MIKKVGEVWITEETRDKNFPKHCIVSCDIIDMDLDPDFPILLKQKGNVHYEVYSTSRERYKNTLNKMLEEKEMIEKKVKCIHCDQVVSCVHGAALMKCSCGKVSIRGNIIVEGVEGKDFIDVSPQLLNENV